MALGQGYPALASDKERKQVMTLDERINEIDRQLAQISAAIGGNNHRSMATIFSTADKPISIDEAREGRTTLVERARIQRQQLEQQRASLVRQRGGMETGIQQRRLAQAEAVARKLPAADNMLRNQLKQHPEQAMEFIQEAQARIAQGIQGGASPDEVIQASVHLRSVAALVDSLRGLGTYGGEAAKDVGFDPKGAGQLGPTEQQAVQFIQQSVPKFLRDSGVVPQVQPTSQPTAGLKPPPFDTGPEADAARAVQESRRAEAPMPNVIERPTELPPGVEGPQQGLADVLQSFASRPGQAPSPGPGQQFVFTGHQGEIQAGTAPAGATNPFAQMTQDPAMAQRIMEQNITRQGPQGFGGASFSPSPTPVTPQQQAPLVPTGPVTQPPVAPPAPSPMASGLGLMPPPVPGQSGPSPAPTPTPTPPPLATPPAAQPTPEQVASRADQARQFAANLVANGIQDPSQIRAALQQQFPDLAGF